MYVVYNNNSLEHVFNYCNAEEALLKQGFREVFPEELSAEQYRIYDSAQQTDYIGDVRSPDCIFVEFVAIFFNDRHEYAAIYKVLD